MIPVAWRYLGRQSLTFEYGDPEPRYLPFSLTSNLVGVKARTNQEDARHTWVRGGYLSQYLRTDISANTSTGYRLVRLESQVLEFPEVGTAFKLRFRPVPWILQIDLDFYVPR